MGRYGKDSGGGAGAAAAVEVENSIQFNIEMWICIVNMKSTFTVYLIIMIPLIISMKIKVYK